MLRSAVRGMCTFLQPDSEWVPVGFLYFDEAVREEDDELKDDAEKKAEPERPDVCFGVGKYDADCWYKQKHQQNILHFDLNIDELLFGLPRSIVLVCLIPWNN